jgi:hypothetical protein
MANARPASSRGLLVVIAITITATTITTITAATTTDSSPGVNGQANMQMCQGDCDHDSDCAGDLKCFQRDGTIPVPGCLGTGTADWDYCYDSSQLDSSPGVDGQANMQQMCQGDCDHDSDCAGDLKCFQRDGTTPVPGCLGTGTAKWDYCYDSSQLDSSPGVDGQANMQMCQGDCDHDSDCAGDLKCFQRDGTTPVPGCLGTGTADWDYCYNRSLDSSPMEVQAWPMTYSGKECCVGDKCDQSVLWGDSVSFSECQIQCTSQASCVGIEYGNENRCTADDSCYCYLVSACSNQ